MIKKFGLILFLIPLILTSCSNLNDFVNNSDLTNIESNNKKYHTSLDDSNTLIGSDVDIKIIDMVSSGSDNNPVKIILDYNEDEIEIISTWNDGIKVSTADFSDKDNYKNIYITELGTDIQCITYVFKYDESRLFECFSFPHLTDKFLYNGKGDIYYYSDSSDFSYPNRVYNYETMEIQNVDDESIINELMEY